MALDSASRPSLACTNLRSWSTNSEPALIFLLVSACAHGRIAAAAVGGARRGERRRRRRRRARGGGVAGHLGEDARLQPQHRLAIVERGGGLPLDRRRVRARGVEGDVAEVEDACEEVPVLLQLGAHDALRLQRLDHLAETVGVAPPHRLLSGGEVAAQRGTAAGGVISWALRPGRGLGGWGWGADRRQVGGLGSATAHRYALVLSELSRSEARCLAGMPRSKL